VKIAARQPPPPPPVFEMEFDRTEGVALVAMIRDYVHHHPQAANIADWKRWADELDRVLRP
jgi:hypothetical protein